MKSSKDNVATPTVRDAEGLKEVLHELNQQDGTPMKYTGVYTRDMTIMGIIAGSLFGLFATIIGVIVVVCTNGNDKIRWQRFTLSSIIGWLIWVGLWFGGCVVACVSCLAGQ